MTVRVQVAIDAAANTENSTVQNGKPSPRPPPDLHLFGFDLTHLSPFSNLLVGSLGVFVCYLIYGILQEMIFKLPNIGPHASYINLVQFFLYFIFSAIELQFHELRIRRVPLLMYALLAGLTVATIGLSNVSVVYLNYPTQVVFKSCKLVPVLIGGILIQNKRFNTYDWAGCILMCLGLVFFTLADVSVSPSFDFYGVALISWALLADAVIGNVQERTMREYGSSNVEMVYYSYSIGAVYLLAYNLLSNSLLPSFQFFLKNPLVNYGYLALFSLSGYVGVNFVLHLVKTHGALIAVTVTTARKAVTIVLSFLLFPKPFTWQYIWSGLMVCAGIMSDTMSRNAPLWDARFGSLNRALCGRIKSRCRQPARSDSSSV